VTQSLGIALALGQIVGVDEVWLNPRRIDRQCLRQQFFGVRLVAKTDRPAGDFVIQRAQAGVRGAIQCIAIQFDGSLKLLFGGFGDRQRAKANLPVGRLVPPARDSAPLATALQFAADESKGRHAASFSGQKGGGQQIRGENIS